MKKAILALALVALSGLFFTSCRSKEKCAAYSSATAPTKAHSF
ncbi:MAG: hypothetical protein ABIS12_02950 [Bacteroidia bacterium]